MEIPKCLKFAAMALIISIFSLSISQSHGATGQIKGFHQCPWSSTVFTVRRRMFSLCIKIKSIFSLFLYSQCCCFRCGLLEMYWVTVKDSRILMSPFTTCFICPLFSRDARVYISNLRHHSMASRNQGFEWQPWERSSAPSWRNRENTRFGLSHPLKQPHDLMTLCLNWLILVCL